MAQDIPLQSESEFTSDMVKAVENIAQNVKAGSSEFSTSIDALSKSIDSLRDSLLSAINSLKTTTLNISRPRASSSSSSEKVSSGKSSASKDPAVLKQKEEEKKAREDLRALRLKTAQEKASFNAEQLALRIKKANEAELSRKKKKDADAQQLLAIDVFENVGKGFGDVFAVTEEQVAAMKKSGKKGKKEKPFVMDMEALSTEKKEGLGIDVTSPLIKDISESSKAWEKVFDGVSITVKQWKDIESQQKALVNSFENIGHGFGDIFAVTKEQVAAMKKSGKKGKKEKPFVMDMAALATASVETPEGPGTDLPKQFILSASEASNAWSGVFKNVSLNIENQRKNEVEIASLISEINLMLGDASDQAKELSLEMQAALDPRSYFQQAVDALASVMPPEMPAVNEFEQLFNDLGDMFNQVLPNIDKQVEKAAKSFSDSQQEFEPYYSPYIGTPKEEPMIPRDQLVGPTQEDEATYNRKKQLEQEAVYIKESVDNFGIVFEAMFGKMGKSLQDNISAAMSSINKSFSGKSPVFDFVKKIGFSILGFKSKGNTGTQFLNSGGEVDSIFKPKGTDTVPAMLTPGEAVIKKSAAEKPENKSVIDAMNMSSGGKVGYFAGGTPTGGGGGIVGGIASLALGPVGTAFSVLTGSVKAASQALSMFGGFVAKANPAIIEQLNLAMNDLQGVIGRALVPEAQKLLQPLRYLGDGMDFIFKTLTPAISPLVNAFKTLITPLIQVEATVAGLLAPAFQAISTAIEGFSIILDPIVQLISEVIESFTQFNSTITFGTDAAKIMGDGFKILGEIIKGFVGLIVTVMGLFMSGMGVILQGVGYLVQGFASLIKGIGGLISKIPMMGTVGAILTEAGIAVESGSESIKSGGADLQKRGEDQRDRGLAKAGEAASNVYNKFADMNYKMKDETRFKPGDVTGKGIVKGSSVGAAVREAQSTSIAGVGDEIRKQALMAATGTKTQEESLKDISDKLNKDNLRDAFRDGMIAANGANKGNSEIKGKDPFAGMSHSKPTLAPV